ncbi:hypothetical protein [Heyndrickxia ginsengihumi]
MRNLKLAPEKQGGTVEYKVTDVISQEQMEELARLELEIVHTH